MHAYKNDTQVYSWLFFEHLFSIAQKSHLSGQVMNSTEIAEGPFIRDRQSKGIHLLTKKNVYIFPKQIVIVYDEAI